MTSAATLQSKYFNKLMVNKLVAQQAFITEADTVLTNTEAVSTNKTVTLNSKTAAADYLAKLFPHIPKPSFQQNSTKGDVVQKEQPVAYSDVLASNTRYGFATNQSGLYNLDLLPEEGRLKGNFGFNITDTEQLAVFSTYVDSTNDCLYLWAELETANSGSRDPPYIYDWTSGTAGIESLIISPRALWLIKLTNYDATTKTVTKGSLLNAYRTCYSLVSSITNTVELEEQVKSQLNTYWGWKLAIKPNAIATAFGSAAQPFFLENAIDGRVDKVLKSLFGNSYDPQSDSSLETDYQNFINNNFIFDVHCAELKSID